MAKSPQTFPHIKRNVRVCKLQLTRPSASCSTNQAHMLPFWCSPDEPPDQASFARPVERPCQKPAAIMPCCFARPFIHSCLAISKISSKCSLLCLKIHREGKILSLISRLHTNSQSLIMIKESNSSVMENFQLPLVQL